MHCSFMFFAGVSLASLSLALFLQPSSAQNDCVNFWVNPTTGEEECFGANTELETVGPSQAHPSSKGNLVINGSFERPRIANNDWRPLPSIQGWSLSFGPAIEVKNVDGRPFHGRNFIELDSHASSGIYQDIKTQPGQKYTLSFAVSGRPGTPAKDNRLLVLWDKKPIQNIQLRPDASGKYAWKQVSVSV